MEHSNWKILIADKALFFNKDKQRYCLIAPRYLTQKKTRRTFNPQVLFSVNITVILILLYK
jgi:hypothetical protein